MITRKLTSSQKILFFLIANALLIGGIFAARVLGFTTESFLALTAAMSLEMIYLAFSIQRSINKTTQALLELEKNMADRIRENEEKTNTALIYIGHQMKMMQHELLTLKKHNLIKLNGNVHHPKVQA